MTSARFIGLLACLGAVIGCGVIWQQQTTANLRGELGRKQRAAAEESRLKHEHAGLLAQQVSPEELLRRKDERAAWVALTAEITALRDRIDARKTAGAPGAPPPAPRTLKDAPVPVGEWSDAGQATPAAALETVLWAAAGGEVEKLAAGLELDDPTRATATAVFKRLPPALQREVGQPEQLVALLTARDVPLGTAWILGHFDEAPEETRLVAQFADPEGNKRDLTFTLRAHEGRWRLVVPPQAMTKYTAFLQGKPAEPAAR